MSHARCSAAATRRSCELHLHLRRCGMSSPLDWSASELVRAYAAGTLSPVETIEQLFERIDRVNHTVNALFAVDREGAFAAALASQQRWRSRSPASEIDGVPVSIKDHLSVRGMPIVWGCKMPEPAAPAPQDCAVVARLREAGAIVFGKTT